MKKNVLISMAALLLQTLNYSFAQNVIHSTTNGGLWPDNTTWIEAVPSNGDSVVLQGPVSMLSYTGWCKSLNITTAGSLGGNGNQGNLYIYGSMYNSGSVNGQINYDLHGNLVNNQPWTGPSSNIKFRGLEHTITCSPGASINAQFLADDSLQNLTLLSDLVLNTTDASNLGFSQLEAANHKLSIASGEFNNCRIHSTDTLEINSYVSSLDITGDYILTGNMTFYYNMVLNGKATNFGTITFATGVGGDPLRIKGDFINKGHMNHSWVQVENTVVNEGEWSCENLQFTGTGDKHISQTTGHPYGGGQISSDISGSVIYLDTDVEFTMPAVHLNNNTLNCGDHLLTSNSTFYDGTLYSDAEIAGNNDFWTSTFTGSFKFSGNNRFSNCMVDGILENTGLMKDITYYGGTFSSYQHLLNRSSIQSLNLKIYGDLTNFGTIDNNTIVDVSGIIDQNIEMTQPIESQVNFYSDLTGTNYQWIKDGQDIYNANSNYLHFSSLQLSDAGIYKCRVTASNGTAYSREIIVNNTTGLTHPELSPENLKVYPNPVRDIASIEYYLPENSTVSLEILNMSGARVFVEQVGEQTAGPHYYPLNCSGIASGIYFLRFNLENKMIVKKIHKL